MFRLIRRHMNIFGSKKRGKMEQPVAKRDNRTGSPTDRGCVIRCLHTFSFLTMIEGEAYYKSYSPFRVLNRKNVTSVSVYDLFHDSQAQAGPPSFC